MTDLEAMTLAAQTLDRSLSEAIDLLKEAAGWNGPAASDWRERANKFIVNHPPASPLTDEQRLQLAIFGH